MSLQVLPCRHPVGAAALDRPNPSSVTPPKPWHGFRVIPGDNQSLRGFQVQPIHPIAIPSLTLVSGSESKQPSGGALDPVRFLLTMSASLDLDEVVRTLNAFLGEVVAPSGWSYRSPGDELCLAEGQQSGHSIQYQLKCNEQALGVLKLWRNRPFTAEDQQQIEALLALAVPSIHNALRFFQINRQLERDPLTGLGNRRALTIQGAQWLADCIRHRHPLSLLVLDLDRFKMINDTYGHPVGDRVLCQVAEILRAVTRTADLCVRLGGDEFVVLLPGATLDEAKDCAERIRQALAEQWVETETGERIGIGASIGAASHRPGMDLDQLYHEADAALYAVKQARPERAPRRLVRPGFQAQPLMA
ncbi:GGDEF domain-containing protein [Caldichromatium japonicum]|nr:GGDEF domain-containing protein [Caldichromatium japonicum]